MKTKWWLLLSWILVVVIVFLLATSPAQYEQGNVEWLVHGVVEGLLSGVGAVLGFVLVVRWRRL